MQVLPTPCQWHGRDSSCALPPLSFLFALAGWNQRGEDDVGWEQPDPEQERTGMSCLWVGAMAMGRPLGDNGVLGTEPPLDNG